MLSCRKFMFESAFSYSRSSPCIYWFHIWCQRRLSSSSSLLLLLFFGTGLFKADFLQALYFLHGCFMECITIDWSLKIQCELYFLNIFDSLIESCFCLPRWGSVNNLRHTMLNIFISVYIFVNTLVRTCFYLLSMLVYATF